MIRVFFAFVFIYIAIHTAIQVIRSMSGKEKWEFIKTFAYAMGLSIAAVAFMTAIVILF